MVSKTDKELLVALDIGTSKITAIVGEVQEDGETRSDRLRFASLARP